MKSRNHFTKLLFLIILVAAVSSQVSAQCVIDNSITTVGITPDSATNFVAGTVGVAYNQVIQVRAPVDSVIIVGGFPVTAIINFIEVTTLSGLPP
jgi:hypothetical protein